MQAVIMVPQRDLDIIYQVLLALAGGEGLTVAEALCQASDHETGMRIYQEVFDD